jgi:site-specific DNA recombinase
MTTKRLAELDERADQLNLRMTELRDELAAAQRETVSAAQIQRAVALFDPVWDLLLVPERFRILHLLLESVVYDGATGELELAFYPLGITKPGCRSCHDWGSPLGSRHDPENR